MVIILHPRASRQVFCVSAPFTQRVTEVSVEDFIVDALETFNFNGLTTDDDDLFEEIDDNICAVCEAWYIP